jgi:hypothetical protein
VKILSHKSTRLPRGRYYITSTNGELNGGRYNILVAAWNFHAVGAPWPEAIRRGVDLPGLVINKLNDVGAALSRRSNDVAEALMAADRAAEHDTVDLESYSQMMAVIWSARETEPAMWQQITGPDVLGKLTVDELRALGYSNSEIERYGKEAQS